MFAIIIEGVLFVALVAACGALLLFVLIEFTPLGRRLRETRNRRRIERAAELTCPIHGALSEGDMVRLPSGERICPKCYQESVWQTR
jgi:hypothetical protein